MSMNAIKCWSFFERYLLTPTLLFASIYLFQSILSGGALVRLTSEIAQYNAGLFWLYCLSNIALFGLLWLCLRKMALFFWFDIYFNCQHVVSASSNHKLRKVMAFMDWIELAGQKLYRSMAPVRKAIASILAAAMLLSPISASVAIEDQNVNLVDEFSSDLDAILSDIRLLVEADESLAVVKAFYGETIDIVKLDPMSFDLIDIMTNSSGSITDEYTEMFDEGLSFNQFSQINMEYDPSDTGEISVLPDSFIGYLSFFLSLTFLLLLVTAASFRVFTTVTLSTLFGGSKGDAAKAISGQLVSGIGSMILTAPLYKGYNILGVFMISCIVIGVGMANFLVILIFKYVLLSSTMNPIFNPNTNQVFDSVLDMMVCKSSVEKSIGNPIEPEVSGGFGKVRIDFGHQCGMVRVTDSSYSVIGSGASQIADFLDSTLGDGVRAESNEIVDELWEGYIDQVLPRLVVNMQTFMDLVTTDLDAYLANDGKSYDTFIDDCLNTIGATSETPYAAGMTDRLRAMCASGRSEITQELKRIKTVYASDVGSLISDAINKLELAHSNASEEEVDARKVTTAQEAFQVGEVEDTANWELYKGGWIKYPIYVAGSRAYGAELNKVLQVEVEVVSGRSLLSRTTTADVERARSVYGLIKRRASVEEESLYNPKGVIEAMQGSTNNFADIAMDITGITQMDNNLSDAILNVIMEQLVVDQGEHVVTSLTDTGHWLAGWIVTLSAAGGALQLDKLANAAEDIADATSSIPNYTWAGMASGALVGVSKPYIELVTAILPNLFVLSQALAWVFPGLVFYYFHMAFLKWLTQTIKTAVFVATAPLKLYNSTGSDLFGQETSSIVLQAIVIGASPVLIIGSFMAVEVGATPLINVIQVQFLEFMRTLGSTYAVGMGYIIVATSVLAIIPFAVLFWLYAFPIKIQDSLPQFLSINLANFSPEGQLGNALTQYKMIGFMNGRNKSNDKPNKDSGDTGNGGDGGGGNGSGGGADSTPSATTANSGKKSTSGSVPASAIKG